MKQICHLGFGYLGCIVYRLRLWWILGENYDEKSSYW